MREEVRNLLDWLQGMEKEKQYIMPIPHDWRWELDVEKFLIWACIFRLVEDMADSAIVLNTKSLKIRFTSFIIFIGFRGSFWQIIFSGKTKQIFLESKLSKYFLHGGYTCCLYTLSHPFISRKSNTECLPG